MALRPPLLLLRNLCDRKGLVLKRHYKSSVWNRQVFRIDHHSGKETVVDLLVQRFAKSIFELSGTTT